MFTIFDIQRSCIMNLFTYLFFGLGLSLDSLAVSISTGMSGHSGKLLKAFWLAFIMAFFHALMPFIGWLAGKEFKILIAGFDHWIAFVLLFLIGGKMIYEGWKNHGNNPSSFCLSDVYMIIGIAIATSIDALIIGISFGLLEVAVWEPIIVIASVVFIISFTGVMIGKYIGNQYSHGFEIAGGVILISIGLKILIEHIFFLH